MSQPPAPRPIQYHNENIVFQYRNEDGVATTRHLIPAVFADVLEVAIIRATHDNRSAIFRFRNVDVDLANFLGNSRIETRTNEEGVISLWFCHDTSSIQFFDRMFADLIRVNIIETNFECIFENFAIDQNARETLNRYVATGESIRTSRLRSVEFDQINDLIVNFDRSNWIRSEMRRSNGLDPKKMFIAITAPSFTGKTQLAFSVIDKKPLYFVLNVEDAPIQPIYLNYSSISETLIGYVREDLLKIPRVSLKNITKSKLLLSHSNLKFKSLGFIFALMIEANEKFGVGDAAAVPWMEFFADRRIGGRLQMQFQSKSINDCRNDPRFALMIQQYFLFLDEFPAKTFSAFLRNLSCALEFTCVVAATNTNVANLIGLKTSHASRSAENTIWCVVVSRLPLLTIGFEDEFARVKANLQIMAEERDDPQELMKMTTLLNFFYSQLKLLRPGIGMKALSFLIEAADRFVNLRTNLTFTILEFVLIQVSNHVKECKSRISRTKGQNAHISLFSSASFNSNYAQVTQKSNQPSFIRDHLYFLSNPAKSIRASMFLLWSSRSNEEDDDDPADLEFAPVTRLGVGKEEFRFKSVFDSNEILLMMSLFLIKPKRSTSKIIEKGEAASNEETVSAGRNINPTVIANSGQLLENMTVCSFIQSSHLSSLNGTDGIPFLCEVIRNFIVNFRASHSINLTFGRGIKPLIVKYHIPFLYTSNIQCPRQLKALINCGNYMRTSNAARIDAHFDIFKDNEIARAVIECKDHSRMISVDKFITIINKGALHPGIKIHFTVCNSIGGKTGQNEQNIKLLGDLADSKRYNIYRVRLVCGPPSYSFGLIRFRQDFKYKVNPTIIFIVLELNEINGI